MAKKAKKVAARQAQLRVRSKKSRSHGPSGIPVTGPTEAKVDVSEPIDTSTLTQEIAEEPTRESPNPVVELAKRRSRARGIQVKPIETYFVQEIRRIAIVGSGIVAILIALIFVMP